MSLRCRSQVHSQPRDNSSSSFRRRRTPSRQALRQQASPSRHRPNRRDASPIPGRPNRRPTGSPHAPADGPNRRPSRLAPPPGRPQPPPQSARRTPQPRPNRRPGRRTPQPPPQPARRTPQPAPPQRPRPAKACCGQSLHDSHRPTAEATATKTATAETTCAETTATETTTPEAATTEDQGEGAFAVASDLIMARARGSGRRGIADKPNADNPSTAAAEINSLFNGIVSYSLVSTAMLCRARSAASAHILPRCNALPQFDRSAMATTNRQQINLHQFAADAEAHFLEPSM